MSNDSHLLLQPDAGQSISRIFQFLTVAHTWQYDKRHHSSGHVWQGRFRSPVIQDDEHALVVLPYIEANPLCAATVAHPGEYCWSSFQQHGMGRQDPLLSAFPGSEQLGARKPSGADGEPR